MKIILVNKFHYQKGGSETYYFGLAEGLKKLGHEVHFFAMEGEKNLPCEDSDLFVSAKDYNGPSSIGQKVSAATSLIYSNEAKEKFEGLCERVQPDVVHMNLVHRQITLSILDAPYLKEHKVPVLFTSHDYILVCPSYVMLDGNGSVCDACLDGHFGSCIKRKCVKGSTAKSAMAFAEAEFIKARGLYKKIDCVIAPSEFMKDKLIEGGFTSRQVLYMQNFAKEDVLINAKNSVDNTDREHPYLLFFGRLSKEKGVDVLIDAFADAIADLPSNLRLVIAGDGPERASLDEKIASLSVSVSSRIEFVGFKSGEDLKQCVEGASLAIVSSQWRENMPYSIVEAFALGTPVIGTNIGGISELVLDGKTGYLARAGDSTSLAAAIKRGVASSKDLDEYARLQRACRSYVLEHCSQTKYMNDLVALYEQLIDTKKGN